MLRLALEHAEASGRDEDADDGAREWSAPASLGSGGNMRSLIHGAAGPISAIRSTEVWKESL
jgi:hypothetical protein